MERQAGTPTSSDGARLPTRPTGPGAIRFVLLLLGGQAAWIAVAHYAHLPLAVWFAGHAAMTTASVVLLQRACHQSADCGPQILALLATAIAGPVGAALAAAAIWRLSGVREHPELLSNWYERIALAGDIDPVTSLSNTVDMGRAVQTSADMPRVFSAVMNNGSLEDCQTALGLIARRFSPAYAPALRAALVSNEPVIRVQAAAVAVKVRAELKSSVLATMARVEAGELDPQAGMPTAANLKAIVNSGLLEDQDRDRASAMVARLVEQAAATLEAMPAGEIVALDAEARALIETELLRTGHFGAFRTLRNAGTPGKPSAPELQHG